MCLFPVRAEPQEFGRPRLDPEGSIMLPCGKCYECKSKRAVEWATRCGHEISCHESSCFLTLTYDEDNLPSFLIVKDEFQRFLKRLRKHIKKKVKYIVSHEYGSKTGRPHHHVIIFGWEPSGQEFLFDAPSGEPLYTSFELSKLWPYGFHSIGSANERTAYYIASYSLKAETHEVLDSDTGDIVEVSDCMDCSKRTAIGFEYFIQNMEQLVNTSDMLPRYYVKLMTDGLPKNYLDKLSQNEIDVINSRLENCLEIYQNKVKFGSRDDHQKLAKFKIIESKKELQDFSFRSENKNLKQRKAYDDQLRSNRDLSQRMKKNGKS